MSKRLVKSNIAPWLGFAAAIWVQIAAGNTYSFPLYSSKMKSVLKYSQGQLDTLGVAVDIGENVGLLAGFLCNRVPPWGILAIGSTCCFFGYGVLWLVLSGTISPLPFWLIWIAQWMGANSATWLITAALVTNMRNFPQNRGTVSGILKGLSGLGGAVFTEIFTGFLRKDPINLLLFLTIGPLAICAIVMYFVRPCMPSTADDSKENKHLFFIQCITVVLALYLLLTSFLNKWIASEWHFVFAALGVGMLILISAPIIIPIRLLLEADVEESLCLDADSSRDPLLVKEDAPTAPGDARTSKISCASNPDLDTNKKLLAADSDENLPSSSYPASDIELPVSVYVPEQAENSELLLLASGAVGADKKKKPRRGQDFNIRQALVKLDFWLLFAVFFCGVGSGVTVLNNLAQIGQSEGYDDVTVLLSIIGVCNFLGRLGGGVISEHYVRKSLLPRTFWMGVTQFLMMLAFLFFATALSGSLHICSFVLGICYGVQFSIMVPTASEIFGLKHFGMIYNFQTMGNPLGALLFSSFLAGYLYDKEAEKQAALHPSGDHHVCLGANCFRLTFLIMAGVCAVGVLISIFLTKRLRIVYETLYGKASFRIQKEKQVAEKV